MEKLDLDYYYGMEAEQFTFYRLPKALITDGRFKNISNNAKLLYGLMLDRMSLSRRRGWLDKENRVYIKYSILNIAEDINVAKNTSLALLKELQDVGLIDLVQQNGKANVIYVKNFISGAEEASQNMYQSKICTSPKNEPVEYLDQSKIWTGAENEPVMPETPYKSVLYGSNEPSQNLDRYKFSEMGGPKFEQVPSQFLHPNNTISKNNMSDNNPINLSILTPAQKEMDAMDEAEAYMKIIRENIDYDIMMGDNKWVDREMFDELYNLICDVVCVKRDYIRIAGEDYPYSLVKSKFLKLNSSHLQYVIGCMRSNTTKVNNIKAYLITALYNAPNTMGNYYNSAVNHDMYGVG